MANDFTNEAGCYALWNFESGALGTDSKSTNTLTNTGVDENASEYKQGSCAADFIRANSDYFNIADTNLVSGFPTKSGDTTKVISIAYWFKADLAAGATNYNHIGKYGPTNYSWQIYHYGTTLRVGLCRTGTTTRDTYDLYTISTGRWYHFALCIDGVNKWLWYEIYDDTAGAVVKTIHLRKMSYELNICNEDLRIGCNGSLADFFDGRMDEVAIFNRILDHREVRQLRAGTFDGTDGVAAYNVVADVEYIEDGDAGVSQLVLEVLYTPTDPNVHVYSGSVTVGLTPSAVTDPVWAKSGAVTVTVTPSATTIYQPPGEFIYDGSVGITITPSATSALGRVYKPLGIPVALAPAATYSFPTKFYWGNIEFSITPAATYRVPVPGWDKDSGYGVIDMSWLGGPPPFWCQDFEATFTIDPGSTASYSIYAEIGHTVEGGFLIGGDSYVAFRKPGVVEIEAEGGYEMGGKPILQVIRPQTHSEVADGGFVLGGKPTLRVVGTAGTLPTHTHVGRGGFEFGGDTNPLVVKPLTVSHVPSGGFKLGGAVRYPDVRVVRPSVLDDTLVTVVGSGGFQLGGEPDLLFTDPPTVSIPPGVAEFHMGGIGGVTVVRPQTFEFIPEGGFVMGEEELAQRCDAWALTGFLFEASAYTNFNFNSFAEHGGKVYGAMPDGIYILEGADDNGRRIRPGARIGPTNFGVDNKKRIRTVYCGKSGENTEVRVESENEVCYALESMGRFPIDFNVEGKEFTVDVGDFDELAHLEIIPLMVVR